MKIIIRFGTVCTLAAAVGCSGGTADLAGKVTFEGKPVGYGNVVVIGADGQAKHGSLHVDGTFRVPAVAYGMAKVAVSSPPPPGAGPTPALRTGRDAGETDDKIPPDHKPPPIDQELVKRWFAIPDKYADPSKSGLTVDVASGKPYDINLTK